MNNSLTLRILVMKIVMAIGPPTLEPYIDYRIKGYVTVRRPIDK